MITLELMSRKISMTALLQTQMMRYYLNLSLSLTIVTVLKLYFKESYPYQMI